MATESNYSELLHTPLLGSTYDTVDEIWNDSGNDDEISNASVIKLTNSTEIKYTFLDGVPNYYTDNSEPEAETGEFISVSKTSDLGKAIEYILGNNPSLETGYESFFADVANVTFSHKDQPSSTSNDVGAITFANYDGNNSYNTSRDNAGGYVADFEWSSNADDYRAQADVWLNDQQMDDSTIPAFLNLGDYNFTTVFHEIGHSLGLVHPDSLAVGERNSKHTLMVSASSGSNLDEEHPDMYYDSTAGTNYDYVTSLGLYDIRALQEIYGENTSTRNENGSVYKLGQGLGRDQDGDGNFVEDVDEAFIYTVWDGGGDDDVIDASDFSDGVQIDLREGHFSSIGKNGNPNGDKVVWDSGSYDAGNVAIAYGAEIENAIGTSKADHIIGNNLSNTIIGGAGNDILDGGDGDYDRADYSGATEAITVTLNADTNFDFEVTGGASTGSDDLVDVEIIRASSGAGDIINIDPSKIQKIYNDGEGLLLDIQDGASTLIYEFEGFEKITFTGGDDTIAITGDLGINYDGLGGTDTVVLKHPDLHGLKAPRFESGQGLLVTGSSITNTVDGSTFTGIERFENVAYAKITNIGGREYYGAENTGDPPIRTVLDYSDYGSSLAFDFSGGTITNSSSASDTFSWADIVGTNFDDTFNLTGLTANFTANLYSGTGNDVVNAGQSIVSFRYHYTGGIDVIDAKAVSDVFFATNVDYASFSSSIVNGNDLKISVAGQGSVTLKDFYDSTGGNNFINIHYNGSGNQAVRMSFYGEDVPSSVFTGSFPASPGTDGYSYFNTHGITLSRSDNPAMYFNDASNTVDLDLVNIDPLPLYSGFGGDDTISGTQYSNTLYGGEGNDTLNGRGGNDFLVGNDGNDNLNGGDGNDYLLGGAGSDTLDGGLGNEDIAYYGDSATRVYVDLATGQADDDYNKTSVTNDDTLSNIEWVVGSRFDDTLKGDDNNNQLHGLNGDDTLVGAGGADKFFIGSGLDVIEDFDRVQGDKISVETPEIAGFSDLTIIHTDTLTNTLAKIFTPSGLEIGNVYLALGQTLIASDFEYNAYGDLENPFGPANNDPNAPAYEVLNGDISFTDNFNPNVGRKTITWSPDGIVGTNNLISADYGFTESSFIFEDSTIHTDSNHMPISFGSTQSRGDGSSLSSGGWVPSADGNDYHTDFFVDANDWSIATPENFTVYENTLAGNDTLTIKNLDFTDATFSLVSGSLVIGKNDSSTGNVTINGNYISGYGSDILMRIDEIVFEDRVWDLSKGLPELNDSNASNTVNGTVLDDVINANGGNDIIYAGAGGDTLDGGAGNDIIYGEGGDDTLDGSAGNDYLYGGFGNDSYLLNTGTGTDTATEYLSQGFDKLVIESGLTTSDVYSWADSLSYHVQIVSTGDQISFANTLDTNNASLISSALESVEFSDGTIWDLTQGLILNDSDLGHGVRGSNQNDQLSGNGGNDYIEGFDGDDVLEGGAGNDTLLGGLGNDTYLLKSGTVSDTATELLGEGTDKLVIESGLTTSDVYSWADSLSYHVQIVSTGDQISFANTLDTNNASLISSALESVEFSDGTIWDLTQGLILNDSDLGHGVRGSNQNDQLSGNGGNDYIEGFDGDDVLEGGAGNDTLLGGLGSDQAIFTGAYANYTVTEYTSFIIVKDNVGSEGEDTLYDIETIVFSDGVFENSAFVPNIITGTSAGETLNGTISDNIISGLGGDDTLNGLGGDDTLIGGLGNDTLDGGSGIDTASYANATAAVTIDLTNNNSSGADGVDTLVSIENATGSAFADTIHGGATANTLRGNAGVDTITGWAGADVLYGGAGDDVLHGDDAANDAAYVGAGNDIIYGDAGEDTITGGAGDDEIHGGDDDDTIYGAAGADTIYGDGGDDLIYGDYATAGANDGSDIIFGGAGQDTIVGSGGDDLLHGGDDADTIHGGGGQDEIWGDGGNDIIYGNDDDDTIHGGDGEDIMYGGGGLDTIYGDGGNDQINGQDVRDFIYGGDGHDWIWGYEGDDILYGGNGNDYIYGDDQYNTTGFIGAGDDELHGEAGNDVLAGGDGNDTAHGGIGSDTLFGHNGNDILNGDAGLDLLYGGDGDDIMRGGDDSDTLIAGNGADTLYGDGGVDKLYGQGGVDTFVFEYADAFDGRDLVRDFASGETIDIADVLSGYGYVDGTDVLSDWVQITSAGGHSFLAVDRDGTGTTYGMTDLMYTENYATLTTGDLVTV